MNVMRYLFILFLTPFLFLKVNAGENIQQQEDSLNFYLKKLRASKTDAEKELCNEDVISWVEKTMVNPDAFTHPFDSIKTIGTMTSPDKAFRMINWNVEQEDRSHKYYCYLVIPGKRGGPNRLIEFRDISNHFTPNLEEASLDNKRWYGAVYYKIIPIKKGLRTYYTLVGWQGKNAMSTQRVFEVMSLSGKKVRFSYGMFRDGEKLKRRHIIEFQDDVYVHVDYRKSRKEHLLVFDHVSPKDPNLEGMYEHYITDGSYDAYKWTGSYWELIPDYDARNNKEDTGSEFKGKKSKGYKSKKFNKKK
jgi:hypothetical protein